jgi:hypothetical protein
MKMITLAILAFLSLNVAEASSKKEKIELLKCLRKTINNKRMDQASINKTFTLITSYNHYNAAELAVECKNNLKEFKKLRRVSFKKMSDMAYKIETTNYSARRIITNLIENPTLCKAVGAEADVALGMGIGAGASVGYCHSANGRVWAMLAPEISIHIGGGAAVLFSKSEFYLPSRTIIENDSDDLVYTAAFGVAVTRTLDLEVRAVGVGVGLMLSGDQSFVLKMIPVGQNFDQLIDLLDRV